VFASGGGTAANKSGEFRRHGTALSLGFYLDLRSDYSTNRFSTKAISDGTPLRGMIAMPSSEQKSEKYSDEELEEIMDMHAPNDVISVKEVREAIRDNPLLMTGLVFAFGLLVGVALSPGHRKSR